MRLFFFFKQKTAYEMRISDWSSDVCSSDLADAGPAMSSSARRRSRTRSCRCGCSVRRPAAARRSGARTRARGCAEIGRASCRERVCQYVSISVVAVSLKNKKQTEETKHLSQHNIMTSKERQIYTEPS